MRRFPLNKAVQFVRDITKLTRHTESGKNIYMPLKTNLSLPNVFFQYPNLINCVHIISLATILHNY